MFTALGSESVVQSITLEITTSSNMFVEFGTAITLHLLKSIDNEQKHFFTQFRFYDDEMHLVISVSNQLATASSIWSNNDTF